MAARLPWWRYLPLVLLAGCVVSDTADAPPVSLSSPPVIQERVALPGPFTAPLPTAPSALLAWRAGRRFDLPPFETFVSLLEGGDGQTLDRLRASAATVPAASRSAWVGAWNEMLGRRQVDPGFYPSARFCEAAERWRRDQASPLHAFSAASELRHACVRHWEWAVIEQPADPARVREVVARLRAAGFSDLAEPDPQRIWKTVTVEDVLIAAGRAERFDAENGRYPVQHHRLMIDLSSLARPALDDVVYDERVLCPSYEFRACELTAYADGLRFRTTTEGCDDWYDVEAVARLMNAVLAHRRAPGRLVFLDTDDQTARLAYGTAEAFRAAFAHGLLKPGDGDTAEALGKAFEREVIGAGGSR